MIDWNSCPSVEQHPDRLSGAWVFRGTRVPLTALFENLEDGVSVNDFIELFPGVELEQVRNVLEHSAKSVSSAHWFENFVWPGNASSFAKLHWRTLRFYGPSTWLVKFTQRRIAGPCRTWRVWIANDDWFKSCVSAEFIEQKNCHHCFKFNQLATHSTSYCQYQFSDQFRCFKFLSNDRYWLTVSASQEIHRLFNTESQWGCRDRCPFVIDQQMGTVNKWPL